MSIPSTSSTWQYYLSGEYLSYATSSFWDGKAPILYFNIEEELYESYKIEAVIVLTGKIYDGNLGGTICIGLGSENIPIRVFTGILWQIRYEGSTQRTASKFDSGNIQYIYRIWLYHKFEMLKHETQYYISENMTKREIITKKLADNNILTESTIIDDMNLKEETNTQYGETTSDYIIRLMQESGLIAFFDAQSYIADNQKTGVLYSLSLPTYIINENLDNLWEVKLDFHGTRIGRYEFEQILEFTLQTNTTTQTYKLHDYNFKTPETAVDGTASIDDYWANSIKNVYPTNYDNSLKANIYAKNLLNSEKTRAKKFKAYTTSYKVAVGKILNIENAASEFLNGRYFIEKATYTLQSGPNGWEYKNIIEGVVFSPDYRPMVNKLKPKIHGNQTAIVVGNSDNNQVNVDNFGRVQVQFIWSGNSSNNDVADESKFGKNYINVSNPSRWARLMQWGPAGNGWGNIALPRVGQEVVVGFLNADPDMPIILGSVYNGLNQPAYSLPENNNALVMRTQTLGEAGKTGLRYNELRMVDKELDESVSLRAQHNFNMFVGNDSTKIIENDELNNTFGSVTNKIGNSRYEYFGSLFPKPDELLVGTMMLSSYLGASIDLLSMEKGLKITHVLAGAYAIIVGLGDLALDVKHGLMNTTVMNYYASATGFWKVSVTGISSMSVGGSNSLSVGGNNSVSVSGDYSTTVEGLYSTNVTGEYNISTEGIMSIETSEMNITSEAALNLTAGAELSIKAAGALTIDAADINIVGASISMESAAAFSIDAAGVVSLNATIVEIA